MIDKGCWEKALLFEQFFSDGFLFQIVDAIENLSIGSPIFAQIYLA